MPVISTPTAVERKFLRDRMKQHIDGRAMPVHRGAVGKTSHVSAGHATHHHVAIARADEHAARKQQVARLRFLHFQRRSTRRGAWRTFP